MTATAWMDVHHHLAPPEQIAILGPAGAPIPAVMRGWTVEQSLREMEAAGIHEAILSITSPGLWHDDDRAVALARACNEYSATLVRAYPGRFSFFGALPVMNPAAAIAEADNALDVLGARGVLLFTNTEGKYLGDPQFSALLDHLNTKAAIVFVHPIGNACCTNIVPGIPEPAIEYGAETARTIASLLFSEGQQRRRALRFVFSHAGGVVMSLTERLVILAEQKGHADPERFVLGQLARFFYDTAQAGNAVNLVALRQVVPIDQIAFGSDYPFLGIARQVAGLRKAGLSHEEFEQVMKPNAALFR